jgi:outer membrane murein-binding lipoprotein Lpp
MRYTVGMTLRATVLSYILLAVCVAALPLFAHAQQDDLRATIMAQVLQDPRSAEIPPAQLEVLVDALSQKAQAENLEPAERVGVIQRMEELLRRGVALERTYGPDAVTLMATNLAWKDEVTKFLNSGKSIREVQP